MNTNAALLFKDNLQKMLKEGASSETLRKMAGLVLDLSPAFPAWMESAVYKNVADLDMLLSGLSKKIYKMYNDNGKQVLLFAPDVFLAKVGYETVCKSFPCRLFSGLKRGQEDFADAHAVFVSVLPYEQPIIPFRAENAILLNPGRFNSIQLKTVSDYIADGASVLLLDSDNTKRNDLANCVRRNDKEKLDFLLARWGIEKETEEKDRQLEYIIAFLEAMAE